MQLYIISQTVYYYPQVVTSLDDGSQAQEMLSMGAATATASGNNGAVVVAAMQLLCALVPETPLDKPAMQSRFQDIVG